MRIRKISDVLWWWTKISVTQDQVEKKNAQEGTLYRSLHAIREQLNVQ
jgi:hypothetical protein